ncbi:TAXI family TRAP transporter solute-binding subunit [Streptomyces sp. 110]|uniref:TAXI family TRAP transporter solute-binding subunit n=1 Tax=Streptomyces endocoffeicus TaxID=2898945 RepID=A0ABS1PSX0_9ACTN|nr:TAXI family TRAP transporter solute-binding subunit [Streptomyces endocoffeicus]MBL1114806.1 TAXI family TRAP transporter solute-binding subunit [Streptomyces endocoffeicus]
MALTLPRPDRRRALQSAAAGLVALGLLLWWLLASGGGPSPSGRVTFATGVSTGVYDTYGRMLEQDLARDLPDVDVRLEQSRGSPENVERLARGRATFAIAATDAVAAYQGEGAGRLRACARLYDDYMQLVVPRGSSVRSARNLKHLRVGVGGDGSGVQLITRALIKAAGLDFDRDIRAERVGIDAMPRLLRQGKLDAFFWSGGLPTTAVRTLAHAYPIRLVQLGDLTGPLHRQGGVTRYYRAATVPADAYEEIRRPEPVKTIAVPNLLVTTDRVAPDLAEGVTRTVIDNRDRIGAKVHAAQKVDLRTAVFTDPLALHKGAARYYRSVKP